MSARTSRLVRTAVAVAAGAVLSTTAACDSAAGDAGTRSAASSSSPSPSPQVSVGAFRDNVEAQDGGAGKTSLWVATPGISQESSVIPGSDGQAYTYVLVSPLGG
jgi:hypothetical protein